MHKLIALWAHPRSMSTAIERIMRERFGARLGWGLLAPMTFPLPLLVTKLGADWAARALYTCWMLALTVALWIALREPEPDTGERAGWTSPPEPETIGVSKPDTGDRR